MIFFSMRLPNYKSKINALLCENHKNLVKTQAFVKIKNSQKSWVLADAINRRLYKYFGLILNCISL